MSREEERARQPRQLEIADPRVDVPDPNQIPQDRKAASRGPGTGSAHGSSLRFSHRRRTFSSFRSTVAQPLHDRPCRGMKGGDAASDNVGPANPGSAPAAWLGLPGEPEARDGEGPRNPGFGSESRKS